VSEVAAVTDVTQQQQQQQRKMKMMILMEEKMTHAQLVQVSMTGRPFVSSLPSSVDAEMQYRCLTSYRTFTGQVQTVPSRAATSYMHAHTRLFEYSSSHGRLIRNKLTKKYTHTQMQKEMRTVQLLVGFNTENDI